MDKVLSLLRFYKKNGTEIRFRGKNNGVINYQGKIISLNFLLPNERSLVLSDDKGNKTKFFLEDIDINSIVPLHLVNQKNIINKRIQIPPKLRFEILKRDNFTCTYCGQTKDETELEVDHVKAVSKGGTNDPSNLVTSCFECNRGKGGANVYGNQ